MHKIGSDTIIASSTELKRSSRDGLRESALFKDFAIDGADGYTAAEASLSTGETIERVFTYSAHYPFYSDALQCADRSGAAEAGSVRRWISAATRGSSQRWSDPQSMRTVWGTTH